MVLPNRVAFVTGCNGISGNAIVEHLIRTPDSEWSKIIITSRRPLAVYWQDPRIEFVAIDYLQPVPEIIKKTEDICKDVTHAFFTSYVHNDDFTLLYKTNVPLFQNFLDSLDAVAPNLQHICLQTGGKHYGGHVRPIEVPVRETMPRYDDGGENFYYPQEDYMFALQKKRTWTYNIIRPHANGMSEAITVALYFLVCRELGEPAAFPGNKFFYNTVDDCSYAPGIADMSVWASTHPHCANEAFNHVNGDVFTWRYFWPALAKHFGLTDIPEPVFTALGEGRSGRENNFNMTEWAKDKKPVWDRICEKYGGKKEAFDWGTWDFFDWTIGKTWLTFGTNSKSRKYGWTRVDDTYETWIKTFKQFEGAGILPPRRVSLANQPAAKKDNAAVRSVETNGKTPVQHVEDVHLVPKVA